MRRTADFWRGWLNHGAFPDHPWRGILQRSALTLKGLTYAPTGALLAAATTSLPETPGGERNWDYRYSWVRDAAFALWGLYTLGFDYEANSFFYFIADQIGDGSPLKVLYAVDDGVDLDESTLDHLTGYEDARPVRIGNDAHDQEQHDIWGALLHAVHLHTRSGEFLSGVTWENLERQVECAIERWAEPDRGIWENRGEPRHFTSSKIMCWVALDRGALLAETMGNTDLVDRWRAVADEIKADVLEHGVDERGVFTESYGSSTLDASVLLGVLLGFLPPDDPRMRATVHAIADELTDNGLVLRYRVDETDDGLSDEEEGTFAICSFWLVSALVEIGELDDARALLEKLLALASPLGLYAEELDPRTGRHLGNFPQAFTHLALINATMQVIRAERARGGRSRRSGDELSVPDRPRPRYPTERIRAHEMHSVAHGIASRRSSPIGSPQLSQMPYVPSSSFSSARSTSASVTAIEFAVPTLLRRSTASVVPSPIRLPNETAAMGSRGTAVSDANSSWSSRRRSSSARVMTSASGGHQTPSRSGSPPTASTWPLPSDASNTSGEAEPRRDSISLKTSVA